MKPALAPIFRLLLTGIIVFCFPLVSHAQKRIGVIMSGDIPYYSTMHGAFVAELKRILPANEDVEIILQRPFPDAIAWSNAARKLIAVDVDLIVTYGTPATQAVLHEKSQIPVIYAGVYDPDNTVLTGKYVTGCGFKVPLSSLLRYFKRLKKIDTLNIVFSSIEEDSQQEQDELFALAGQQDIKVQKIDIRARADLKQLETIGGDAVFITGSSLAHIWLDEILSIARKKDVLTADIFPDKDEAGVLITLFQPPETQGKRAAEMASQVLGGQPPKDIQPVVFRDTELVFNLLEAHTIGITFPIQLIVEATRVIK